MAVSTIDSTGLTASGVTPASLDSNAQYYGFKNRIINGAMVIDQRNAGAAVTTNAAFPVDRFSCGNSSDGAYSAQQNSSAPVGFVNSTKITITTADSSLTTTQVLNIRQFIEGTNIADLAWGTADAKTVTLSFWVRSSLTGTFGGALRNSAADRSYPFTYTISSANTWEQKSVTIAGDTSGTWLTTTGIGIGVFFSLGAGPDRSGTANAWTSGNILSATGAVAVVGTLNATFYITGVQLEKGSTATSFDYRPYGTELALCQRYYQGNLSSGSTGTSTGNVIFRGNNSSATGSFYYWMPFSVLMRSAPTMGVGNPTYSNANSAVFFNAAQGGAEISFTVTAAGGYAVIPWLASAEL